MNILENLLLALPTVSSQHSPTSPLYQLLATVARREVENLFSDHKSIPKRFGLFGDLVFPYHQMGTVDSLDLMHLNELVLYSFYWANRKRYRRVVDVGANIGLHSILLSKCGYEVKAYEPDSQHFKILHKNLLQNHCACVQIFNTAISSRVGVKEFVRVVDNTTSSHLAGSKAAPYGPLERFSVPVEPIEPLLKWADLIKLDVEGHEKEIILATSQEQWIHTDALVEVGSEANAAAIYEHAARLNLHLFSQKSNWERVLRLSDIPITWREGTLFITSKDEMLWS